MSGATYCTCDTAHVERVMLSPLHILGPGEAWRAARPGNAYIAGHGWHFAGEAEANAYAFGSDG